MSPKGPDSRVALSMLPLFERGQLALVAYVAALPAHEQPMGGVKAVERMNVITAADFDKSPRLVRQHVCRNACMIHILCEDGHLCAIVEPRVIQHW